MSQNLAKMDGVIVKVKLVRPCKKVGSELKQPKFGRAGEGDKK